MIASQHRDHTFWTRIRTRESLAMLTATSSILERNTASPGIPGGNVAVRP
jgi:hypothetical protein